MRIPNINRKIIFLIALLIVCSIVVWVFSLYKSTRSISQLKSNDWMVRESAMQSLIDTGKPAVGQLIKALKNEDADTKWRIAKILGDIGDNNAVGPVVTALKDEDKRVRYRAIEALANIGDKSAVEFLNTALNKEKDLNMQMKIKWALQTIEGEDVSKWHRQELLKGNEWDEWRTLKALRRQFKLEFEQQRQKLLTSPDWLKVSDPEKRADLENLLQENIQRLLNERTKCLEWAEKNKDQPITEEALKRQKSIERYAQTLMELKQWLEQHRTEFTMWE